MLRDMILAASDLERREVFIPEWGVTLYVRTLTGLERDEFEASLLRGKGPYAHTDLRGMRARLAIATCVDENGVPVFTVEDAEALGRKSARALSRIFDVAAELNGLSKDDVEDMVGNSAPGPSGDSPSD